MGYQPRFINIAAFGITMLALTGCKEDPVILGDTAGETSTEGPCYINGQNYGDMTEAACASLADQILDGDADTDADGDTDADADTDTDTDADGDTDAEPSGNDLDGDGRTDGTRDPIRSQGAYLEMYQSIGIAGLDEDDAYAFAWGFGGDPDEGEDDWCDNEHHIDLDSQGWWSIYLPPGRYLINFGRTDACDYTSLDNWFDLADDEYAASDPWTWVTESGDGSALCIRSDGDTIVDADCDDIDDTSRTVREDDEEDPEEDEDLDTVDNDGDGYSEAEGDCDDGWWGTNPGHSDEWYDGQDNDCDGSIDEGCDSDDAWNEYCD